MPRSYWMLLGLMLAAAILVAILSLSSGCKGEESISVPTADNITDPVEDTSPGPVIGVREGDLAPDFVFEKIVNSASLKAIKLSDFRDKVVLINFWATWCPYCDGEMSSFQELHDRYQGMDFVLVAINYGEDGNVVENYIRQKQLTFFTVTDSLRQVAENYRIKNIPTSFLIDKNGIIAAVVFGSRDWNSPVVHETIDALLEK